MRRLSSIVAVLIAVLFAVAVPASATTHPAAAVPVLTRVSPGGPAANPGDVLTASLTPGTSLNFPTQPGGSFGLFCKQSVWGGQLLSNPPAPGTAVIRLLNPFTISSCYDNSPTVTGVVSVSVGTLPTNMQVSDSSGFPIQILPSSTPLQITVTLNTTGPTVTCIFQAAPSVVQGNAGPGGAPWVFTNQQFRMISGSLPACGTAPTAFLTAQYSPVLDTTAGGSTIFVN